MKFAAAVEKPPPVDVHDIVPLFVTTFEASSVTPVYVAGGFHVTIGRVYPLVPDGSVVRGLLLPPPPSSDCTVNSARYCGSVSGVAERPTAMRCICSRTLRPQPVAMIHLSTRWFSCA